MVMFDFDQHIKWDAGTAFEWLESNGHIEEQFLWECWNPNDHDLVRKKGRNPRFIVMYRRILEDWIETDDCKMDNILNYLATSEGKVLLVTGARESGKTATVTLFAEKLAERKGKKICYVVDPKQPYPWFAQPVSKPQESPPNSMCVMDEAALRYNSRTSMLGNQNRALGLLFTLRHSGRNFVYITQRAEELDARIRRQIDGVIAKRRSFLVPSKNPISEFLDVIVPRTQEGTLFWTDYWHHFIRHTPLPDCWTEKLSKSFAPISNERAAIKIAYLMYKDGNSWSEILMHLSGRGVSVPERRLAEGVERLRLGQETAKPEIVAEDVV